MLHEKTYLIIIAVAWMLWGCDDQNVADRTTDSDTKPSVVNNADILKSTGRFFSVYKVSGRERKGEYSGEVVLSGNSSTPKNVHVVCRVTFQDGFSKSFSGYGKINNGNVVLSFTSLHDPADKDTEMVPVERLDQSKTVGATREATGHFDVDAENVELQILSWNGKDTYKTTERWNLIERREAPKTQIHKAKVESDRWNAIEASIEGPGVVNVTVSSAGAPLGLFLPKGVKPPAFISEENADRPLPILGNTGQWGWPQVQTPFEGAMWSKHFNNEEAKREWIFWWRDEYFQQKQEFRFDWIPFDWRKLHCNPWVNLNVSPATVSSGEPITIQVQAHAWAGLNMYWWFGDRTGITQIDRAHTQSGRGRESGSHSWTIQIDQPGTYSFGANARDVLYPEFGVAHQASEGCGLSFDTVEVKNSTSKSYSVAFIILAPENTDTSSPEFQAQLNRVNEIKAQLPDQFDRSTDGRGTVDVSYPTVVLTPTGPVFGLEDTRNMWIFIADVLKNNFYSSHHDAFDFIAFYEVYPDKFIGGRHLTIQTKVAGFGITPSDSSAVWGSQGRLRGIGLIADARELPNSYDFFGSKMHLLLHEVFGHQWGVRAASLTSGDYHFVNGIQSPNFSVLYGRPWIKIDDNNYTTANLQDPVTGFHKVIFHPWMLYVAGMKLRSEVPQTILNVEPDTPPSSRYDLVTTTGASSEITLQSIIDESGDRYDVP